MTEPNFSRTNEEGRYEFTRLAPGSYRIVAMHDMSSPRYVSPSMPGPGMSFGKPIDVADGQKLQAPDVRLPRASVLAVPPGSPPPMMFAEGPERGKPPAKDATVIPSRI